MTAELPSALLVEPGQVPSALPSTLDAIEPPLRPSLAGNEHPAPITLFLTVDVEDSYFERPILMTGEGIGREFGVFGILDELDRRGFKATFFVNVYEKDRQPPGVVESVVREIAERGHEVGLHSHPSLALEFYRRPLFRLSRVQQTQILNWGADLILEWTGERPISFRAGGYALNDDTFEAMDEAGIMVDSSCFFPSPNNQNLRRTVNASTTLGKTIEVPVTTVLRAASTGELAIRKLDLDWLSVDELRTALVMLGQQKAEFAMYMMHSFSFIEKKTCLPSKAPSPRARFVSSVQNGRYVEVYGPKPSAREALSRFLAKLTIDASVQVRTLRDGLSELRAGADNSGDVVPVISGDGDGQQS